MEEQWEGDRCQDEVKLFSWLVGRRWVQQRQVEGSQKRLEVDGLRSFEVDVEVPKDYQGGSIIREDAEEHVQLLH